MVDPDWLLAASIQRKDRRMFQPSINCGQRAGLGIYQSVLPHHDEDNLQTRILYLLRKAGNKWR